MKKKVLLIALLSLLLIPLVGCKKAEDKRSDAVKFKEEYESLNKVKDKDGNLYRTISIDEENPIIYTTSEDLTKKIEDKETFLVYFGSKESKYSRTVVPYLLQQAKTQGIDKIYYIDITPGEDEEGTKAISAGDVYFAEVVKKMNEPNLNDTMLAVFVNGNFSGKTTGVSPRQTDGNMELTPEMKTDMTERFKEIYIIYNSNRE